MSLALWCFFHFWAVVSSLELITDFLMVLLWFYGVHDMVEYFGTTSIVQLQLVYTLLSPKSPKTELYVTTY
jgi:hypothetical protein